MSQEYQNSENYVPTNELFLEIYVQEHRYHTIPTGIMGPFSEGQKEPLCMHMRFLVPLLLDNNINNFIGTHTQNYSFKRHHEPRSKTGSDHYPYNIVMCVFTRQPSPKQLSEENGRNFGEKANETINYLSQTIARIAENGLNSQESKNYNFFESFNIFEQFS